jgi:hypothetical protein
MKVKYIHTSYVHMVVVNVAKIFLLMKPKNKIE